MKTPRRAKQRVVQAPIEKIRVGDIAYPIQDDGVAPKPREMRKVDEVKFLNNYYCLTLNQWEFSGPRGTLLWRVTNDEGDA